MPHYEEFDLDIPAALSDQLVERFNRLSPGALDEQTLKSIPRIQGVYQLLHKGNLVYVGKASNLPARLLRHLIKIGGRRNIQLRDVEFKCMSVRPNWATYAPEDSLIRYYRQSGGGVCEWNGNGFGNNDPGRDRETTEKSPDGFDAIYPIRNDWPCTWVEARSWNVLSLLVSLKDQLPFLLRYQTDTDGTDKTHYTKGHPDHRSAVVVVPRGGMTAEELLGLISGALPGWQATRFPSHMILYKEDRPYSHGVKVVT